MISDEELQQLLAPSHQQHVGPLINPDPISRDLAITGQLNPVFEREFDSTHGRYLSGLGATQGKVAMQHDKDHDLARKENAALYDLEAQDDVLGSGIFDPQRRPATANGNVGVFASHYSLPGYHAREVPFAVNTEVTDITSGADVVGIPSGGLNYIEQGGRARPYGRPQTQYEPYAEIDKRQAPSQWDVDSVLNVADGDAYLPVENRMVPASSSEVPNGEVPSFLRPSHPRRKPMWNVDETPSWPSSGVVPQWPAQQLVGRQMSVTPAEANFGIPTQRHYRQTGVATAQNIAPASAAMAPGGALQRRYRQAGTPTAQNLAPASYPMSLRAPQQRLPSASIGPGTTSASLSGFLPEGTGTWLVFLGAGVVGGVALRMLFGGKNR